MGSHQRSCQEPSCPILVLGIGHSDIYRLVQLLAECNMNQLCRIESDYLVGDFREPGVDHLYLHQGPLDKLLTILVTSCDKL